MCVVPLLLPDTRSTLHKTESRKICCLFLFICFVLLLEFNSISLSRKWTYNNYSRECAWQVPCMPVLFFFILSFQRINSWSDCTEEREKNNNKLAFLLFPGPRNEMRSYDSRNAYSIYSYIYIYANEFYWNFKQTSSIRLTENWRERKNNSPADNWNSRHTI